MSSIGFNIAVSKQHTVTRKHENQFEDKLSRWIIWKNRHNDRAFSPQIAYIVNENRGFNEGRLGRGVSLFLTTFVCAYRSDSMSRICDIDIFIYSTNWQFIANCAGINVCRFWIDKLLKHYTTSDVWAYDILIWHGHSVISPPSRNVYWMYICWKNTRYHTNGCYDATCSGHTVNKPLHHICAGTYTNWYTIMVWYGCK